MRRGRWPSRRGIARATGARGPDDLVGRRDRHPAAGGRRRRSTGIEALLFPEADEVEDLVVGRLATSALFASRFRENAGRALLLPRRRPGTRTPLWQQRQRAADLLAGGVALRLIPDPGRDLSRVPVGRVRPARPARGPGRRGQRARSRSTASRPRHASPFAVSLMFDYVAAYMYDGDTPLAERRAGALTLDRDLLRELLGQEELRELLDPEALADLELSLQSLTEDRRATSRRRRPRPAAPAGRPVGRPRSRRGSRAAPRPPTAWLDELAAAPSGGPDPDRRRGPLDRDRGRGALSRRRRDLAAGRRPGRRSSRRSVGALDGLLARFARTHGPFLTPEPAAPLGSARRGRRATRSSGWSRPARSCAASSGRAGPNGSGATRKCCACSGAAPSRASGARSSRSIRRRSLGSCRTGRGSHRSAVADAPPFRGSGRARAPRRGRRPAGRAADSGIGPRARRAAGADPRLPAAAARRARRARRGGLGRAGEPRS